MFILYCSEQMIWNCYQTQGQHIQCLQAFYISLWWLSRLRVDPYWNLWRHVKPKNCLGGGGWFGGAVNWDHFLLSISTVVVWRAWTFLKIICLCFLQSLFNILSTSTTLNIKKPFERDRYCIDWSYYKNERLYFQVIVYRTSQTTPRLHVFI